MAQLTRLHVRERRAMWAVSKHDVFCIQNEDFCIKNEELCIKKRGILYQK